MNSFGDVVNVTGVDPGNGNPAVLGAIDGVLTADTENLLSRETGEGEHADLIDDVGPVLR